jgi:multicomponent Na+:H+ antiporter subunit G
MSEAGVAGVAEIAAAVLLLSGVALSIIGGIGINRFPDVFARMHAATKPITLGLALVLLGAALLKTEIPSIVKLLLAAGLQFITAPVAAHMVGRAAYRAGTERSPGVDELANPPSDERPAPPGGASGR